MPRCKPSFLFCFADHGLGILGSYVKKQNYPTFRHISKNKSLESWKRSLTILAQRSPGSVSESLVANSTHIAGRVVHSPKTSDHSNKQSQ